MRDFILLSMLYVIIYRFYSEKNLMSFDYKLHAHYRNLKVQGQDKEIKWEKKILVPNPRGMISLLHSVLHAHTTNTLLKNKIELG